MLYDHITYHKVGSKNLFILPTLPSWIVLNDIESLAMHQFSKTENESMTIEFLESHGLDIEHAKSVTSELKGKLKVAGFYPLATTQYSYHNDEIFPTDIHLCLTRGCNLRCTHCYISADYEQVGELDLSSWKIGFTSLFQFIKNPNITISGGEPTQKKFLKDLILFLNEYANVTLFTNGKRNIDDLEPYLSEVQVSLDGISETTNDPIRGLGSFVKIEKFIKNFPVKSKLTVAITVMAHNFDEIKSGLLDFIDRNELSVKNIRLNASLENEGRAKDLNKNFTDFHYNNSIEIAEFVSSISNTTKDSERFVNKLNCGIGLSLGIDSNGDIYPCDEFINKLGNIMHLNIESVLKKSVQVNRDTQINNMPYCQTCDLKNICLGGCKAKNLALKGSYYIPDCNADKKRVKYTALAYGI